MKQEEKKKGPKMTEMKQEEKRKGPKRIILDVPEEIHILTKTMASRRGISLKKYVLKTLIWQLNNDKKTL